MISSVDSTNPMVTFDSGRVRTRPRSSVVSIKVLSFPNSMIPSRTLKFSLWNEVTTPSTRTLPSTTRSWVMWVFPETTRTFDPTSST